MTIPLSTSTSGALASLSDLIDELRDELDNDSFDLNKIYRAIARAEARFNRDLRVSRMETEATLDVTSEETDLPTDFLEMRHVYSDASPDVALRAMSPAGIRVLYGGQTGTVQAFAIENLKIVVAPVGTATLNMVYYAQIPALTNDNPVNWLLQDMPDLYIHQCLAILYAKLRDTEAAQMHLSIVNTLIDEANRASLRAHWGNAPLTAMLLGQVAGARQ